MVKCSALSKFSVWLSFISRETTSVVHRFIIKQVSFGETYLLWFLKRLSKFAKRNVKVLHTQASSRASCSGKHHRSSTVSKIALYHLFRSSFRLWMVFKEVLLPKCVSNCSNSPFQHRWCFPEFNLQQGDEIQSPIYHMPCCVLPVLFFWT